VSSPPLVIPKRASDRNRSRIVLTLGQRGPLSRAELARLSGVTRTTIGTYVDRLIEDGVLEEVDDPSPPVGRGRPSRPVWFREDAGRTAAVILDQGRIEVALVNARGEIRARDGEAVPDDADVEEITELIKTVTARVGADDSEVLGLGLAITAMVDEQGRVLSRPARFPELEGDNLTERLQEARGTTVVVDNDSRAAALAELWWGRGRSEPNFWAVQIGEGIGGGEVIDGALTRGHAGAAGEVGHMTVDRRGPWCACGFRGCWETIASTRWLLDEAISLDLFADTEPDRSTLPGDDHSARAAIRRLVEQADAGGDTAERLVDEFAANIALGLTSIVRMRDPALLVLQGPVTAGGPSLLERIDRALHHRSLLHDDHTTEVAFSDLGGDARLFGAAALVLAATWALDGDRPPVPETTG